jgi:anti-sigma factor (TIGR02949 family)
MSECAAVRDQLDAYQDGELDADHASALERHLAGCRDCARAHEAGLQLRQVLRQVAPYHVAPPALRRRLASLATPRVQAVREVTLRLWQLLALVAASAAVSAACLLLLPNPIAVRDADDALVGRVVDAHAGSLLQDHLLDVVSTDRHTVKPWFAGKLEYSPPVLDLQAEGFVLKGGRVDYVDGRAVAALVYERRAHRINVFVWPSRGARLPGTPVTVNGYHTVAWEAGGMTFYAVSDLNAAELTELSRALRLAAE